ncbi:MAG: Rpn family recombination-promoting nuclease/putative transposase [Prevotellaceae bacterium]|jgi:predicted transposase/invertase (TIGR01784 family)|nr:Rpn family recombination-promoting nuclease/putative transposase [Prevotellaceae bacterium]
MGAERLNFLNDYLFLKYMGEEGDEEQLISFLSAVLKKTGKEKIRSVQILENRLMSAEIIGDKSSVLDLRAIMDNGSKVNIEVQLRDAGNMDRRSLFYWSREYISGISAGGDYAKIPNVITINILGTNFIEIDEIHASFHIREDIYGDYRLTDALEMHFIDMVNFRHLKQKDIVNNALHRWLAFFDKNTDDETIKKIIEMDTAIKKAHDKIMYVAQDREALHAYHMREMAIYDYNSGMNASKERGREEGKKEGREESKKEIAVNLKQAGFSAKEIAGFIGKTVEDVNKILEEQGLS